MFPFVQGRSRAPITSGSKGEQASNSRDAKAVGKLASGLAAVAPPLKIWRCLRSQRPPRCLPQVSRRDQVQVGVMSRRWNPPSHLSTAPCSLGARESPWRRRPTPKRAPSPPSGPWGSSYRAAASAVAPCIGGRIAKPRRCRSP